MSTISSADQLTEFLLYTTPQGEIKVEVFLHDENLWLTQKRMAELFGKAKSTINEHIKNIYKEGELTEHATMKKFGNPELSTKPTNYYNLDIVIAVGYRTNSYQATQFRIRATTILKEYIIKGFTMDDERLKNGKYFGKDYFDELLERVRSIRTSERRIYLKITDIFAECSIDYNKDSPITKEFFATVQNLFHYAITGKTAAEIIYQQADHTKKHMGLTTRKNSPKGRILNSDSKIAKNYLQPREIEQLEKIISSYFDYIELLISRRKEMTMADLSESVIRFLQFNEYKVLSGKGNISSKKAKKKASEEYDKYNKTQSIDSDFENFINNLPKQGS